MAAQQLPNILVLLRFQLLKVAHEFLEQFASLQR
jgi:hypothetical protein